MLHISSPSTLPYVAAHFELAIFGIAAVSFSKCAGLAGEVGVEEFAEGGENRFAHRFPVRASFPNLVLSGGAGPSRDLWDWFYEYHVTGRVAPRDGQVTMRATVAGEPLPVRVWSFQRGWPVKMSGPDLDAQASAVAIESIEIVHHGLRLV